MFTPKELFKMTMPFMLRKLYLGVAYVVANILSAIIILLISSLFGETGLGIGFLLWLSLAAVFRFVFLQYIAYMVKTAHIAVLVEAITTGMVPADMIKYGTDKVKEKFVTANVFFVVDKLVSGAVQQINRAVGKIGGLLSHIPGLSMFVSLLQMFINVYLNYIDECCVGYIFMNPQDSSFKGACDGICIYFQNGKKLMASAAKTIATVIGLSVLAIILTFLPIHGLFALLGWNGIVAFILAYFIVWLLKYTFLESYIMIRTLNDFLVLAEQTELTFSLYEKLCKLSRKFKDLFDKGKEVQPELATASSSWGDS